MNRPRADEDVFRAIADPTRRAILDRLRAGPAPVNALADDFKQTRPAVSKHLRVLRLARLVTEERVCRAISDPRELKRWWGSPEAYQAESWEADLRVGGRWRVDGKGVTGKP